MALNQNATQLLAVLRGLGIASDSERRQFEETLGNMRNEDGFVEHLMLLINSREVETVMRIVAVACLNDNVKNYYANTTSEVIGPKDKRYLMANLVDSITLNFEVVEISETYQEVLSKVCKVEYPQNWPQLVSEVAHKMYSASEVRELTGSLQTINTLVVFSQAGRHLPKLGRH